MDKTTIEFLRNTGLSLYLGMCLYLLVSLVHGLASGRNKDGKP